MKLVVERRARVPRVPLWAFLLIALWLALVGLVQWLGQRLAETPIICHLRLFTGIPCPTCGTTRAVLALLDGRPLDALSFNPLMVVLGVVAAAILSLRLLFSHQVILQPAPGEVRWLWLVGTVIFLLNWGYVIAVHQHY